jgi:Zn-dependent peptidase ImmA (M78 family)
MTVNVGGHRYSDPDVLSLVHSGREPLDPRVEVIRRARELNERLRAFDRIENPRERLEILASLADITVSPMAESPSAAQNRAALLFQNSSGQRHAYYDPTQSEGRVNFSIAHEIVHSFFPNSITGARFRSVHTDNSREATELERLCDLGASELLMPEDDFIAELGGGFGLNVVPNMATTFGSSYEATLFRLATTHPRRAMAGRLIYRYRKAEEKRIQPTSQIRLFSEVRQQQANLPVPKYRRQSLHSSASCGPAHLVRWNKSFDPMSCVYDAKNVDEIKRGSESLPNLSREVGSIECIRAPYQGSLRDDTYPDVLFLWWR